MLFWLFSFSSARVIQISSRGTHQGMVFPRDSFSFDLPLQDDVFIFFDKIYGAKEKHVETDHFSGKPFNQTTQFTNNDAGSYLFFSIQEIKSFTVSDFKFLSSQFSYYEIWVIPRAICITNSMIVSSATNNFYFSSGSTTVGQGSCVFAPFGSYIFSNPSYTYKAPGGSNSGYYFSQDSEPTALGKVSMSFPKVYTPRAGADMWRLYTNYSVSQKGFYETAFKKKGKFQFTEPFFIQFPTAAAAKFRLKINWELSKDNSIFADCVAQKIRTCTDPEQPAQVFLYDQSFKCPTGETDMKFESFTVWIYVLPVVCVILSVPFIILACIRAHHKKSEAQNQTALGNEDLSAQMIENEAIPSIIPGTQKENGNEESVYAKFSEVI